MKIVVTDHAFGTLHHEEAFAKAQGLALEVHACVTAEETLRAVTGAQVVFNNMAPLGPAALAAMASGALVIRYGVGVDNVDMAAASAAGVRVCNVPDYGAEAVADHALAMLLALLRRLPLYDAALRDGAWGAKALVPDLPAFSAITVGLLGFGRIAQATAKRLRPFGFRIKASDPVASQSAAAELGVTLVDFQELLADADALSLHLPLTDATRHLIDAKALATLPDGAVVINVSRGGLIDEAALAAELKSGRIAGAGVDVFEDEPVKAGAPLLDSPNTLLSPHAAFYSNASLENLQRLAAEEATRFVKGEPLRCALN
ncbi:MAG: C-terminal binding protein [Rhodospirillales bacterium]